MSCQYLAGIDALQLDTVHRVIECMSVVVGGGDFTILPGTTLEIPPEVPALPVYMNITDDILAEDSESTEIQVKASITRTPVSQQLQTRVTIHDNEGTAPVHVVTRSQAVLMSAECIQTLSQASELAIHARAHVQHTTILDLDPVT